MNLNNIQFEKEGFIFSCIDKNHYKLDFSLENNNIILSKIVDFSLIKLIYDLNSDIYEYVNIEKHKTNVNEINMILLMKHLFEDIGLTQKYSYMRIIKIVEEKKILFQSETIRDNYPSNIPEDAEPINIINMSCKCDIITDHKINFSLNIIFDQTTNIPSFVEKMVGMILFKIFKRVKLFIENIRI
jgi:hypothetical protein